MCVAFFLHGCDSSSLLLLLAFNRDEFLSRESLSCHFWEDRRGVVGGRDCVGGGTWLCASVSGRLAFITNVRERPRGAPRTRGELPLNFVADTATPAAYLAAAQAHEYGGFNLVVADLTVPDAGEQVWYCTNRGESGGDGGGARASPVPCGVHGLSNASLDMPWPKVVLGRRRFRELLASGALSGADVPWDQAFDIMRDPRELSVEPHELPDRGYGVEAERAMSAIFVEPVEVNGSIFGTRSQTVLAVQRDGTAEVRERHVDNHGQWKEERHRFHMRVAPSTGGAASHAAAASPPGGAPREHPR